MKPYGVRKQDQGCCPGHDKYPTTFTNNSTATKRSRRLRAAKKHARQEARRFIQEGLVA